MASNPELVLKTYWPFALLACIVCSCSSNDSAGATAQSVNEGDDASGRDVDDAMTPSDEGSEDGEAQESPGASAMDSQGGESPDNNARNQDSDSVQPETADEEVEPDEDSSPMPTEPMGEPSPTTSDPATGPVSGNPDGACSIPEDAAAEDTSNPDQVVGDGTPESCTAEAFIDAVAQGGIITFDCGPEPVTITLDRPAKVFNDTGPEIVIDGGGLVTLSGGGTTRILYMNTCDEAQVWTTAQCQDQDHPRLTVQNLTFTDGSSKNETEYDGGGAIWVRGGRFKVNNSRFFNNVCADEGPDVGGGAIRVFSQFSGLPVYVVDSTFGGEGLGNVCSNGGALSSIGVSWTVINSLLTHNRAIGNGGNPAESGTPGGGSGGAIYNDGNTMTLTLCGSRIEHNEVNAYGSAIFFVSNDHSGDIHIENSVITNNQGGSWYPTYPQISNHDDTPIEVVDSTIE